MIRRGLENSIHPTHHALTRIVETSSPVLTVSHGRSVLQCDMSRSMQERKVITAAEMARMTPQERADVVDAGICRSWDDVSEPFRTQVLATARELADRLRRDD